VRVSRPLARWLAVLGLAVLALALGYFGLRTYVLTHPHAGLGRAWLDLLYLDVQLFVLQAPIDTPGPFTLSLQIARFLAPATTIAAGVGALAVLMSEQLRGWRAAGASRHAIVTGDGPAALELCRQLSGKDRKVVLVSSTAAAAAQARRYRVLDVRGDPTDAGTLRAAGLRRADEVYACTEHSTTNAATALLAALDVSPRRSHPLTTYAQVRDAEICAALRARRIGADGDPRFRLDFFSVEEVAARVLLDQHQVADADGNAAQVVIVGFGWLGRAVLREIARRQLSGRPPAQVLVQDDSPADARSFIRQCAVIGQNCQVQVQDRTEQFKLADRRPTLMLICLSDAEEALSAGLAAAHSVADPSDRVVLCMGEPTPFDSVLSGQHALLDDVGGRLTVFDVVEEASVPDLIRDDLNDRLARAIHHGYRQECEASGDSPADNMSMRPWEQLPEQLRRSNFAQAAHLGAKLNSIHCVITPETDPPAGFAFGSAEIEQLAEMEHERWVRERQAAGYEYGPERDNRHHPDLVPWADLGERERNKDRAAIKQIPAILRQAGFQILRLPPPR
jgi:hypothetical protein